ncbi:SLBB domain-containing protein [Olivibacter sp. XZL3]|uniref:SLBB domain-containing protein n=1 Tax=Olivibacter sp. XZL3 TaxID=1735116 RepID=UPI001064E28C|nr:SLBB domain-containing protein [Olivibacter sp. XZL3]
MQFKSRIRCFLVFLGFLCFSTVILAQNINTQDLSTLRVDDMTDSQIRELMSQAQSAGLSESQMIQMAQQRGMSQSEIDKLRQRVEMLGGQSQTKPLDTNAQQTGARSYENADSIRFLNGNLSDKTPEQLREDSLRARIYGASLFLNVNPVFEPNLNIATPQSYVIGAGDELQVDIYGNSEASHTLKVSPDGNINIPYVGVVQVGGATIQQATSRIKAKMAQVYSAMSSGATKVNISLGNIRSIKVIITGEVVKPGTYTLPSVASVFNALYSAGGPTSNGSLRSIKVVRGGELIAELDLYDFLQTGNMIGNVNLHDQDVIQVSPYLSRVEMIGEVKRPLLFETKPGETFDQLLKYAGGFTENAYTARLSVIRNTGREYRLEDLLESQFAQFETKSGDKYTVEKTLNRFANRVILEGAVFRPGSYELSSGLTLSMLLKKADGVKEDAYLKRGYIVRLKDDFQREQLSFNVAEVLAGTQEDIVLKREDMVFIPSLFDLREEYMVEINGEVRKPGRYLFSEGMTVQELILQAGGFTEAGSAERIEISRRVHNQDKDAISTSAKTAEVFNVDVDRSLNTDDHAFELAPFDLVNVRSSAGYERQRTVRVEGEVLYPGEYTLSRKDERVSDIIKRAGGLTAYAYIEGASLKRKPLQDTIRDSTSKLDKEERLALEELEAERMSRLQNLQAATINPDASSNLPAKQNYYVGINLAEIIEDPGKDDDLLLEGGDVIRVPKQLQTVKISGEVLSPVTALYRKKHRFKDYISQAGGFSQRALKRRSFVVYANGSARSTTKVLFFNNYPRIKPGSEIFVPQRLPRERLGAAQIVGLGTGLASLAAIIVSLLR